MAPATARRASSMRSPTSRRASQTRRRLPIVCASSTRSDPVIRDRKRLKHLFDFDYRIEIFVPAPERTYGYYIFPLLEGARMIGRMEMKAARAEDALQVSALWPEPGVQFGKGRMGRLGGALERVRRLVGLSDVRFAEGWLRSPRK